MSWLPFMKAFSSRRTRTDDVEFEREMGKLRQMRAVSKRIYKDMRNCNDAETGLMRSNQRLVSNLKSSQHGKTEPLKHTVETLANIADEVNTHSKALKTSQEVTFAEPMKKFNNVYKHVEFHAKQRELKLQEYDKQQTKMDRQGRKSFGGSTQNQVSAQTKMDQLTRAFSSAKQDYERVHSRMMQEMPELFEGRVEYFDLSLQAVIKAQALYYQQCSETLLQGLTQLQSELPDSLATRAQDVLSEEDILRNTEKYLDEIRMLSIVGDTPVP